MDLKSHAIDYYAKVSDFVKLVLNNFPNENLDIREGKGETAREILKHMLGTPHWWMKRADRPMPFRSAWETTQDIAELLDKQNTTFKEILQDEKELHWTPTTSVPWIMLRSASHMMHHASMLILLRHIWGLPSLGPGNPWSKIVDFSGKLMYTS